MNINDFLIRLFCKTRKRHTNVVNHNVERIRKKPPPRFRFPQNVTQETTSRKRKLIVKVCESSRYNYKHEKLKCFSCDQEENYEKTF